MLPVTPTAKRYRQKHTAEPGLRNAVEFCNTFERKADGSVQSATKLPLPPSQPPFHHQSEVQYEAIGKSRNTVSHFALIGLRPPDGSLH
jgi:hypothetical protein